MRDIVVYVEGPSDARALEALLRTTVDQASKAGTLIRFIPADDKKNLRLQVPRRAARMLANDPAKVVFALPDLYPPNVGGAHETFDQLHRVLTSHLEKELQREGNDDSRVRERFRIHCFQYDLEVLLLANPNALGARLGRHELPVSWRLPLEEQNHHNPPKRIVEALFREHGSRYNGKIDAPAILAGCDADAIARALPLRFKPFLDDLRQWAEVP